MGLSDVPRSTVAATLLAAKPPRRRLETVCVRMLKDGHGITSHGRRPQEIKPKTGDVLQVSSDLADNWGGAGYCEEVRETAAEAPPEAAAVAEAIGVVLQQTDELGARTPSIEVAQAAPKEAVVEPPKKVSRGRKKKRGK